MIGACLVLALLGWAATYVLMRLKLAAASFTIKFQKELLKSDLALFKAIKNEINAAKSENVIPFRKH